MSRVKRNKFVFVIVFVVLSLVELGQFSYAHHEAQAKPDFATSVASTSKP